MRLLVVEDDNELNTLLVKHLKREGYAVDSCFDGASAREFLADPIYDAVILDVMIPPPDGITLLKEVRRAGNQVPILLLTARDAVEDKVCGLDAGADDYMIKPFLFEELMARIRVMTRKNAGSRTNLLQVADLTVDLSRRTVTRAGREIILTTREFSVLEYMLRNKGIVLSREMIEQHIWDYGYGGASNIIDVYISCLRRKIDAGAEQKLIHTVRGVGYVLR